MFFFVASLLSITSIYVRYMKHILFLCCKKYCFNEIWHSSQFISATSNFINKKAVHILNLQGSPWWVWPTTLRYEWNLDVGVFRSIIIATPQNVAEKGIVWIISCVDVLSKEGVTYRNTRLNIMYQKDIQGIINSESGWISSLPILCICIWSTYLSSLGVNGRKQIQTAYNQYNLF